jgi:hypothetical protein
MGPTACISHPIAADLNEISDQSFATVQQYFRFLNLPLHSMRKSRSLKRLAAKLLVNDAEAFAGKVTHTDLCVGIA